MLKKASIMSRNPKISTAPKPAIKMSLKQNKKKKKKSLFKETIK